MDTFSSPSSSSSGSGMSTDALMDQIKAQLAQAYAQEFLEVCFCFSSNFFYFFSDFSHCRV
jgi:hypothetical protein